MTYDAWKTRSPDDGQPDLAKCHRCNASLGCLESEFEENEYGEFVCAECEENEAERAWERHCTSSYDSYQQQQINARRFK